MVSNNQVEQYFQFVKVMLLVISTIISEPLVHSAYYMYVNHNLPTVPYRVWTQ